MFCKKCGSQIETGKKFCGSCGEVVELTQDGVQPIANAVASPGTKKVSNQHIGMIACGVVALIAVIVLISIFAGGGNNPERVLRRYMAAAMAFDFNRSLRYSVFDLDDLINEAARVEGISVRELNNMIYEEEGVRNMRALLDMFADEARELLREEYGRNYRVTFDILDSFTLSQRERNSELDNIRRSLSWSGLDFDRLVDVDSIREMKVFTVEATISGNRSESTDKMDILMIRIGRNWRVLDLNALPLF